MNIYLIAILVVILLVGIGYWYYKSNNSPGKINSINRRMHNIRLNTESHTIKKSINSDQDPIRSLYKTPETCKENSENCKYYQYLRFHR